MKENIEDYRKDGLINLDEYFKNNPSDFTYPYYINGYDENNFWTRVGMEDEEKFVYVKPRNNNYEDAKFNVYSELVYEELMKQVGIKCASFDIAQYDGCYSTISENMLDYYPQNEFIINSSELLESRKYPKMSNEYDIEDLYDSIDEYCRCEFLGRDVSEKCIKDLQKTLIADIFALSTDRNVTDYDFIAGTDYDGNEVLELAPLCHNTYALGSNFTDDEIYEMLDNEDMLADKIDDCHFTAGVPEYKRDYNNSYWEDTLYYLMDEDEENYRFAKECAYNMDIEKAISNVEERIHSKIPSAYKLFMNEVWKNRLQRICECIGLDYYKVIDSKDIKLEMEEI